MGTEHMRLRKKSSYEQGSSINPKLLNKADSGMAYSPQSPLTQLQRNLDNQAMQRMFNTGVIQAKLTISQPNDKYEQEADRVAGQIMRMPEDTVVSSQLSGVSSEDEYIQRMCSECKEEEEEIQTKPLMQRLPVEEEELQPKRIQKKGGNEPVEASSDTESNINQSRGSGRHLPSDTRSFMESRFGTDFNNVKVHSDSTAIQMNKEVNSQAFTVGNNIYFNSGRYDPGSSSGKQLLAHELTHVVQQGCKNQNTQNIQRRVQVNPNIPAVNDVLGYFGHLCPGSWSNTGQIITGNANVVSNQSCTCIEDVVNDPNRTYRIQVDPVGNAPRPETLYDGSFEPNLPYPSSGPRTEPGASPLIHMPPSSGSAMDFGSFDPGGNVVRLDNWRILAHELCGHARLNLGYTRTKGDRPEHDSTINTENQIASEHGEPPRGMYNNRRQGESYHNPAGNPSRLVFKLVDGWHYEASTAVQNPPITQGNIQGQVTASSLRIRQGPSTSTPIVGSYPNGTMIDIECQTPGTMVGINSLWDKTNIGYVSDKYVQRPSGPSSTQLPACDPMPTPTTGVIYGRISTAVSRLRIRKMPNTSSPVVGSYARGEMVSILCQTNGTNVLGSPIWNQTDRGYISDRYVERLPPNTVVPAC